MRGGAPSTLREASKSDAAALPFPPSLGSEGCVNRPARSPRSGVPREAILLTVATPDVQEMSSTPALRPK
eukprot:10243944-Alexandrium_andersonii.AAC.1